MHRVLTRYRLARLNHLDRATGQAIRRYEHAAPGDLIHVDIKKLGNIPDGGGHRVHGRATGGRNSSAHRDTSRPRTHHGRPNLGYGYLHNAIDDHSRLAYTEILPDETKESAAAFWQRAQTFFTNCGTTGAGCGVACWSGRSCRRLPAHGSAVPSDGQWSRRLGSVRQRGAVASRPQRHSGPGADVRVRPVARCGGA